MFSAGGPSLEALPMSQFYLHQCPNPALTDWKWGENLMTIIRDQLDESGLFLKSSTNFYNDDGMLFSLCLFSLFLTHICMFIYLYSSRLSNA